MERLYFNPQKDITAYELAVIVAKTLLPVGTSFTDEHKKQAGDLLRHFSKEKP